MACSVRAHLPRFLHINYSPLPYIAILYSRISHTLYRHTPIAHIPIFYHGGVYCPTPRGPCAYRVIYL